MLLDVLKCLSDNKKHNRECTLATLDTWAAAVHLNKMVPYITTALIDSKIGAEGRRDLFDWLSKQLSSLNDFNDAVQLLKPTTSAMTDKSSDVRKAAEVCLAEILRACGPDVVTKNLRELHGPALTIVLERLKPRGAFLESYESVKTNEGGLTSRNNVETVRSNANATVKHGNRAWPAKALPLRGSRSDAMMSVHDIAVQSQALLSVKDSNKEDRERIVVRRFKFEEMRIELVQDLENDLMKFFREDLHRRLLSADFKKQVDGLEMLQKAMPYIRREIIEVLNVLLRWVVLRFCESTTCLLKVLEFLPELFDMLREENYILTDAEAAIFLPCLIEKSGHNFDKVREKTR